MWRLISPNTCHQVVGYCVKSASGWHSLPLVHKQRMLQKSGLHTVYECRSPAARTLLGRRHHGKFLWVNAVAVRHNSSQVSPCTCDEFNGKAAVDLIRKEWVSCWNSSTIRFSRMMKDILIRDIYFNSLTCWFLKWPEFKEWTCFTAAFCTIICDVNKNSVLL